MMGDYPTSFNKELMDRLTDACIYVAKVDSEGKDAGVDNLTYLLSRSESIASSFIEGHKIAPRRLAEVEALGDGDADALAVMRNVKTMRAAMDEVANADTVTVDHIMDLQHTLMPEYARGFRTSQNWIGGNDRNPLGAAHVSPPPEYVQKYMDDIVRFINEDRGNPIVSAALAHGQFENVHPFPDGNGRTGRALIHVIMRRARLTDNIVIPISTVLARQRDEYIDGLGSMRSDGPPDPARIERWIDGFTNAVETAADHTTTLIAQTKNVTQQWTEEIANYRSSRGMKALRSDSVINKITSNLLHSPCQTAELVSKEFGVSVTAANTALVQLKEMGIVTSKRDHRTRSHYYTALSVVDLITQLQRAVGSPMNDTNMQLPTISVPARPQNMSATIGKNPLCGYLLPIAKTTCRRPAGHNGQHRS
ncbi:Fic family protein [Arthrobacter bambusae]